MQHDSLESYFQNNFIMLQHHKWSWSDLESMLPWERHAYIMLLKQHLKEEEQRLKEMNHGGR